jgi:hypothetical protein
MRLSHSFVLAVFAPILANCSTHPLIDDVTRSTTFDVVEKIRCEAKRAIIDMDAALPRAGRLGDDTTIGYEFTFDIAENNDASGSLTWFLPITGGNFQLTAGAGSQLTRETTRNFTITDTFGLLRKADCTPQALEKNWIYPIAGEIGIYEVVATFAKLYGVEDPQAADKEVFSFHDTLQFSTFLGAGVQPTLTLVGDRSRVTNAGATLSARRSDFHQVVITLTGKPQTATAVARLRPFSTMRSAGPTNNHALAATLLQTGGSLRESAIRELDRARLLALQNRVRNQIVGP